MFPGLDLYNTDPAQALATTGKELDDLDHDLSDLCEVCTVSLRISQRGQGVPFFVGRAGWGR